MSHTMSQSLFHQVCVRSADLLHDIGADLEVAIPFSSGLCSFTRRRNEGPGSSDTSQSLFHQVCVRSAAVIGQEYKAQPVAIPFSSGLCSFKALGIEKNGAIDRRNPFFIRSVFVRKGAGERRQR